MLEVAGRRRWRRRRMVGSDSVRVAPPRGHDKDKRRAKAKKEEQLKKELSDERRARAELMAIPEVRDALEEKAIANSTKVKLTASPKGKFTVGSGIMVFAPRACEEKAGTGAVATVPTRVCHDRRARDRRSARSESRYPNSGSRYSWEDRGHRGRHVGDASSVMSNLTAKYDKVSEDLAVGDFFVVEDEKLYNSFRKKVVRFKEEAPQYVRNYSSKIIQHVKRITEASRVLKSELIKGSAPRTATREAVDIVEAVLQTAPGVLSGPAIYFLKKVERKYSERKFRKYIDALANYSCIHHRIAKLVIEVAAIKLALYREKKQEIKSSKSKPGIFRRWCETSYEDDVSRDAQAILDTLALDYKELRDRDKKTPVENIVFELRSIFERSAVELEEDAVFSREAKPAPAAEGTTDETTRRSFFSCFR